MKNDSIDSLEKALDMLDLSMDTVMKTIPLLQDIDPSISKDIQDLVKLSKGNNNNIEVVIKNILKKNEEKLKDLDNVTSSK